MPEQRYLRKLDDGYVYGYTDALAALPEFVECDKDGRRLEHIALIDDTNMPVMVEMEINGAQFDVPEYLVPTVQQLVDKDDEQSLAAEIKALQKQVGDANAAKGELRKEILGLQTANSDLQKDLSKAVEDLRKRDTAITKLEEQNKSLERDARALSKRIKKLEKPDEE